jgi:hypothetical protein
MADARRRGYGEDGIYFDHRGGCRDSAHHKTCAGRWHGVVSPGFNTDGKRIRKKVSGKAKAELKAAEPSASRDWELEGAWRCGTGVGEALRGSPQLRRWLDSSGPLWHHHW